MNLHVQEYDSFLNESMDPLSATENIIEVTKNGMGWIDPEYAIEMFVNLTGLPEEDQEVDSMLAALADLDLLYYTDDSVSNHKGDKVEFGDIKIKELPHKVSGDSSPMGPTSESKIFKLKKFSEFN